MKKNLSVACMVATLIIFATTMLTGCEEITKEATEAEITATNKVTIVPVHDTTRVGDTVYVQTDTTIVINGDTTVRHLLRVLFTKHISWDRVILDNTQLWVEGTDRLIVRLLDQDNNGAVVSEDSTTFRHRSRFFQSGITGTFPPEVNGTSHPLVNGHVDVFGHDVTTSWIVDEIIDNQVIVNGWDYKPVLQPCHAVATVWSFNNGTATVSFEDAYGAAAGEWSTPYTTGTNPPTGDTVVVDTLDHISSDAMGVANGSNGIIYSEHNTKTSKTYVNGVLVSISPRNFAGKFPYNYSESGSYTAAMVGRTVPFVAGNANFGGYNLNVTQGTVYTVPNGYENDILSLNITHHHDSIKGMSNGVTVYGHWHCPCHADVVTTFFIPKTPTDTTTRRETGRDTSWQCGNITNTVVSSSYITHTIVRNGTETTHYNLFPFTSTRTLTGTTNYIDSWSVSGQASPAAIGTSAALSTDPITGSYTVTIGGATLVINPGNHHWCVLDYGMMVTLTSNGFEVPFVYNMIPGTVTLPVTFNTPDIDFPGHLDCLYIDDSFVGNGSGMTTWMCGMWTMSDGTHYHRRVLLANWGNTSSWTSESVTATEYTNFMAHLSDVNYALAAITSVGTPSGAGYLVHNSDQTTGDYWKTMDGINRNHCNIGGYANGWDGHNPIHFRNIVGGTVNINETVHGITVIGSVQ